MKKTFSIILALLIGLGMFTGCAKAGDVSGGSNSSSSGSGDAETNKKTYEVACIFRIGDMYAAWLKAAFEAEGEKYGDIKVTVMDNQDDSAKHVELVENCIEQKYDYIVVQGRQGDFTDLYGKAKSAGIKMIQINYAEDWSHSILPSILCDDRELGRMLAERAAGEIPENGKVCFLNGPAGIWVTDLRREGFEEGLIKARPDITLLDEQDAGFVKDTAMNKTSDWLQMFDQIDAILAASDSMAVGAIEAFKANNEDTGTCKFYGIDGLTDACTAIIDGTMSASALQDATEYARVGLEMIQKDIKGEASLAEGFEAITYFMPTLLDSSNAQAQFDFYKKQGMVK